MQGLGDLPGGNYYSTAKGVSSDGSVIVGEGYSSSGYEAFRWTSGGGMMGLGNLGGSSTANAVSADGSIVVGRSYTSSGDRQAFVWDESNGMQSLYDLLIALGGGGGLTGWTLYEAAAVSADCMMVAGYGLNPDGDEEAWIATLEPSNVPVPAAVWLLGSGLVGLFGIKRKIKRAE